MRDRLCKIEARNIFGMMPVLSIWILVAGAMSLMNPLYGETLVPAKFEEQSPKEAERKKVFTDDKRGCKVVSKDPAGVVPVDPALTASIQSIIRGVAQSDHLALMPIFHPIIKVKAKQIRGSLIAIERISGKKLDPSMFRAYAINSVDGKTDAVVCDEDGLAIHPVYGHPFQVGVWVQVSGDEDISRLFIVLVPKDNKWYIGSWHIQQWTHAGRDFQHWRNEAQVFLENREVITSWVYLDLATKLLDGGKYIVFPVAQDVRAAREKSSQGKSFLEILNKEMPEENLVYAGSLFGKKGAAILARFRIPKEWSATAIKEHCEAKLKQLQVKKMINGIAGMRCEYVLPSESADKEGGLGAIYIESK